MKGDVVEWIDEIWRRNTNTRRCLDALWRRYEYHKAGFQFYGDSAAKARHTSASESDYLQIKGDPRFKAAGRTVHYPNAAPPVKDRFASCNLMFETAAGARRMYVDEHRCPRLTEDLKFRTEETNEKDATHATDAMGYFIHRRFPIKRLVTFSPQQVRTVEA